MENVTIPSGTIVVGVDDSAPSERALLWAIEQAALERRALTLVHSAGDGKAGWLRRPEVNPGQIHEAMRSEGRSVLDRALELVERQDPDLEVRTVLELVDPRLMLISLSRQAAMVVLGSRGRGPIASMVLGSVSIAVAREATCPVVILRPELIGRVGHGVLVGVDGTERSRPAVEFAFLLAAQRGLPLTALHCFTDGRGTGVGEVAADEVGLDEQWLLVAEGVGGMGEKFPDVEVHLALARGTAEDCLVRAGRTMDVVVLGPHYRHSPMAFFEDRVGQEVIEHADCVVVVVPAPHHH